MLLTAIVGMIITPNKYHDVSVAAWGLLGIAFLSAAGAAINHIVDRSWDLKMRRTMKRPLVIGSLSLKQALAFTMFLSICGTVILWFFTNKVATLLTVLTMFGYAFVYTCWLKHITPQNIVIGGLSGALPPLLGWSCLTGSLNAEPWLLVLIVFAWTPAHFWALAIDRVNDYKNANIPMLPVTHGIKYTQLQILLYTFITAITTYLPFTINMFGYFYLVSISLLNLSFIFKALKCYKDSANAKDMFWFSIYYLMLLFAVMLIDKWVF